MYLFLSYKSKQKNNNFKICRHIGTDVRLSFFGVNSQWSTDKGFIFSDLKKNKDFRIL